MKKLFHHLTFSAALAGLALMLNASFVSAQTSDSQTVEPVLQPEPVQTSVQTDQSDRKPCYRVHKNKHKKISAKASRSSRAAELAKKQGMTVEEVRRFQREHGLTPDGILGPKTLHALMEAKKAESLPKENPKVIGLTTVPTVPQAYAPDPNPEVNQDQAPSLNGGSKIAFSRFGHLDVIDQGGEPGRTYSLVLNGQEILVAESQPSVIGVSKIYEIGNVDAIILTIYNSKNPALCAYRNFALVLSNAGGKLLEIDSCTREYTASVTGSSLYIVYPNREDDRAVGATWRLEGQALTRL